MRSALANLDSSITCVPRVVQIVRHFAEARKPIAAICHVAKLLAAAGIFKGRACTAYPAVQPDIVACGGTWIEPAAGLDSAHIDGNLVTAPAWPAHPALDARVSGSAWLTGVMRG